MSKKIALMIGVVSLALPGCASIVTGENQSLSVRTIDHGVPVPGVNCKLSNDKGTWFVTTPGSVTVHRSYGDLNVRCEKAVLQPGIAVVKSSTKGMAFGNILFGGIIGAAVDASSGAAYDYPPLITVKMGRSTVLTKPVGSNTPQQASKDE